MTSQLYNFLPVEIVWKIYDDLHRSYMKDLNKEYIKFSNYTKRTYEDTFSNPILSHIKGEDMDYICWTDDDIKESAEIDGEITDEIRNQFYNELYDAYDNSFFNQNFNMGLVDYKKYEDYDDFRFN